MSPEQVRGADTDHRSDIFSFGVILYEMLAGQRAFQAESQVETMNAILHADPPEPRVRAPRFLPRSATIVRRCLEKTTRAAFPIRRRSRLRSPLGLRSHPRSPEFNRLSSRRVRRRTPPLDLARRRGPRRRRASLLPASTSATARSSANPRHFQRLTFRRGLVTNARFSPDGRSVVYAAKWEGETGAHFPGHPRRS